MSHIFHGDCLDADQEDLMRGLYYLYQHTKKCNAKAPLIKKTAKKKAKKKAKKVREIAVVFLFGYEPVREDPEEIERKEEFIKGIGESVPRIEKKKAGIV